MGAIPCGDDDKIEAASLGGWDACYGRHADVEGFRTDRLNQRDDAERLWLSSTVSEATLPFFNGQITAS